ncbi:MAG: efflux RND transporter periplasmic adaptor subunit [Myxococcota bacterium]
MLVSSATVGGGVYWIGRASDSTRPQETAPARQARYQCPMHPSIVQDHPGDCPICGMKLVKVDDGSGEEAPDPVASAGGKRKLLYYRSPMDPKVTSPAPKKDEMGMDYVPVYADESGGSAGSVPGQATVNIDPARQQLIGLTTVRAAVGPVGGAWRTVGRVAMDETRVRHINVKVPGFVERVFVDFVGKTVGKGDPLFTVYSPELLSAQEEYLLALRMKGALSRGGALTDDGDALVKAVRRKLALWDVPESEIDRIATTGETTKTLTVHSPVSGVVTRKDVVQGMKLEAGAMPYEIVDLSTVWVLADVYESEMRFVKEGMSATLTLNAFPNREFRGKVLFIDPLIEPRTRTLKVRLAFPNPGGDLRPEMFGEVVLHGTPREGLRIPQDAVIDSGTEKLVFVAIGNGKFQPRIVRLGDSSGNAVEVVSGLTAGEEVVTRANFLVDSESKLRASLVEMAGGAASKVPERARVLPAPVSDDGASPEQPASHEGHRR